ncbi:hypothetical protein AMJ80_08605 [bacterium SM23_31]|nr:MAG: hypothetical protein AMJ80_08605 [bacterium SM23_31]
MDDVLNRDYWITWFGYKGNEIEMIQLSRTITAADRILLYLFIYTSMKVFYRNYLKARRLLHKSIY